MFTRAYRYAIQVLRTSTQYRYAIHVSSLFTRAYRYCVPVRNTGTQYMLQLCLHVRTGIAYMYAHAYHWARRRGERWRCIGLLCPRPRAGIVMCWISGGNSWEFFKFRREFRGKFLREFQGIQKSFFLNFGSWLWHFSVLMQCTIRAGLHYRFLPLIFLAKPVMTYVLGPTFSI